MARNIIVKTIYAIKLMAKFGVPNEVAEDICDVDLEALKAKGIKYIVSDIDQTIVPQSCNEIDSRTLSKINEIRSLFGGSSICLLTNEPTLQRKQLFNDKYGLSIIDTGGQEKPIPDAFNAARKFFSSSALFEEICFIGDRLFTDIVGANNVGMYSIMVRPYSKESDRLLTKLLRVLEILALNFLLWRNK